MLTRPQQDALRIATVNAKTCEAVTGCPTALTIAQWALESGWGRYAPGNNCFGIKVYAGCYGVQTISTHEYVDGKLEEQNLQFATFPTIEACFEKHAQLITGGWPYSQAWAKYQLSKDIWQLIGDIAPVYAPGNLGYADQVMSIIRMPEVQAGIV